MADQFHKHSYKDYQFWTFIAALLALIAMTYFAYQAHNIQSSLQLIEYARQNEEFCNDLEIHFDIKPSTSNKLEEAIYDLRLLNKSSFIFESLETKVELLFENIITRKIEREPIYTFPKTTLYPSSEPNLLRENPDLTNTFQKNISEAKKKYMQNYQPKCVYCFFEWHVTIDNKEHFKIQKCKHFLIPGLH